MIIIIVNVFILDVVDGIVRASFHEAVVNPIQLVNYKRIMESRSVH